MKPPKIAEARPEDFFTPGLYDGFALLQPESLDPLRVPAIKLQSLALASNVEERLQMVQAIADNGASRVWSTGVVFPTVLALASDVVLTDGSMSIGGKYFLDANGGMRLRRRYAAMGPTIDGKTPDDNLVEHIAVKSFRNRRHIGIAEDLPPNVPFVIDAHDLSDLDRCIRDILPLLTLVDRYTLTGPVFVVTESAAKHVQPFLSCVQVWFPHLANRLHVLGGDPAFDQAIIAFQTRHFYYQCRDRLMRSIDGVTKEPVPRRATLDNIGVAMTNSYAAALGDFRRHVVDRITARPATRRVYARATGDLDVIGQDALEARLRLLDFEPVVLSDLTLDQRAALLAETECIVGVRDAGLADILFAPDGCHVIELSNQHALRGGFSELHSLALVARASYSHIHLDRDTAAPSDTSGPSHGIHMGAFEVDVIGALVGSLLDPSTAISTFEKCRVLNEKRRYDLLQSELARHSGLLFHMPDWHVWQANIAADGGDRPAALAHLHHAMILAPQRIPLLKRVMRIAQDLDRQDIFIEAAACFMQLAPQQADDYIRENRWAM